RDSQASFVYCRITYRGKPAVPSRSGVIPRWLASKIGTVSAFSLLRLQQAISEQSRSYNNPPVVSSRRVNRKTKSKYEKQNIPQLGLHAGGNHDRSGHYRPPSCDSYSQLRPRPHHVAEERLHQQPAPD